MLGLTVDAQDDATGKEVVTGTRIVVRTSNVGGSPLEVVSVVATGEAVKEGDVVLQLDSSRIEAEITSRKMSLFQARASIEKSKVELRNAELQLKSQLAEAQFEIEVARMELAEYREGLLPVRKLMHKVEVLKAEQNLRASKEAAESDLAKETELTLPNIELELARLRQKVFEGLTAPKELERLEGAVAAAERELVVGRTMMESDVAVARSKLAAWTERANAEAERVDHLISRLKLCQVKAPHDGVVAAGPAPVAEGSRVRQGQVVLIITSERDR
jgi:multidrug resistance efflux pump